MTDIHIPPEAVEAAVAAANADDPYYVSRSQITAAIRAALKNWPGVLSANKHNGIFVGCSALILPLTEKTDD